MNAVYTEIQHLETGNRRDFQEFSTLQDARNNLAMWHPTELEEVVITTKTDGTWKTAEIYQWKLVRVQ
jgi:hypothetical protein